MFFIGAPLGAIIRKGGLGLPLVFAVLIFIIFHFINTFGKKVAQEGGISPFLGCWMATFVLAPLAIVFTKKATDDKGFAINMDGITLFLNKLFPAKAIEIAVESAAGLEIHVEDNTQEGTLSPKKETPKKEWNPDDVATIQSHYKKFSLLALLGYVFLFVAIVLLSPLDNLLVIGGVIVLSVVFYFMVYKTQQILQSTGNTMDLKTVIVMLGAFPFYPLFYIYNTLYLKEVLSESNKNV
jgi:lipopolysaccharide export system permease protein